MDLYKVKHDQAEVPMECGIRHAEATGDTRSVVVGTVLRYAAERT